MAAPIPYRRVLVYFQKATDKIPVQVAFTQPLVDLLGGINNVAKVSIKLDGNKLNISSPEYKVEGSDVVIMKRPSFCPVSNLTEDQKASIPDEIKNRGVDVGAVAIVESSDGKVLLIRRPKTQRTFPGIWVPSGGHVEENETLKDAGLRELYEETGLRITEEMCNHVPIIAAWESVYPPMLSAGLPRRHHAVVYLHVKLGSPFTADYTTSLLKPDPNEVGACAFLDRNIVESIVATEEETDKQGSMQGLTETFRALILQDGSTTENLLQTSLLLNKCTGQQSDVERVSTGTKHALHEWLKITSG